MTTKNNIELSALASKIQNTEQFLNVLAKRIGNIFHAARCSIYILNGRKTYLTLLGSYGLSHQLKSYQKTQKKKYVEIPISKGVIGLTFHSGKALMGNNLNFFKIEALQEDDCCQYLCSVLKTHQQKIGIVLLQRKSKNPFSDKELVLLENLSSSIADIVEEASALILLEEQEGLNEPAKTQKYFNYIFAKREYIAQHETPINSHFNYSANKNIVSGKAIVLNQEKNIEALLIKQIEQQQDRTLTLQDFRNAVKATKEQIKTIQNELSKEMDELARDIFTGHLLILKDQSYIEKIEQKIKDNTHVAQAIFQVTKTFIRIFSRSKMTAIREKVLDLQDISRRLLTNLLDKETGSKEKVKNKILITHEIFPSQLMFLATRKATAIIVSSSINPSSHIALVSKSLTLPLLSLSKKIVNQIHNNDDILIDFEAATLHVNPTIKQKASIVAKAKKGGRNKKQDLPLPKDWKNGIINTRDGIPIKILANINLPRDIKKITDTKIPIGLYRSEFIFLMRNHFPNEEEQTTYYRKIFSCTNEEVIIRTLDIGGDKMFAISQNNSAQEQGHVSSNSLGLRSVRYLMKNKNIFTTQLRAIFSAAHDKSLLKLLLPFISSMEELLELKKIITNTYVEMQAEGQPLPQKYLLGMMLEIPSVIFIMEHLAKEIDFFSIGSNDLAQFMLATDRNDEEVANLFSLHHPSILQVILKMITTANKLKKEITLCGTMSESPLYIGFLLGCGLRRFSVQLSNYERTVTAITRHSIKEAEKLTQKIIHYATSKETLHALCDYLNNLPQK